MFKTNFLAKSCAMFKTTFGKEWDISKTKLLVRRRDNEKN
jgi:hypothetical protein